jgi:hypothetical protein
MSDKHAQMREMARDLIRDSVIEDAIAQKIAQIIEFIHEDRIKPLEAKLAKALEALRRIANSQPRPMRSGGYEGHDVSNMQRTARATLAEIDGDKP